MTVFKHICAFLAAAIFMFATNTVSNAQDTKANIVGFGDSLMAGYQLPADQSFTAALQAELSNLGHDVSITNAGVSGDTTSGGLSRLDWSVPDGTDLVILELGANDALRGIPPETTKENLDAMLSRLDERGIDVILAGMMAPPNMGADYGRSFDAIFPELAEKHDVPLYVFFMDGVLTGDAANGLLLEDGMHPNGDGTKEMARRFAPLIVEWLESHNQ